MEIDIRAFSFAVSLAAVINGMGIVRLLAGFGEYVRRKHSVDIRHYWVFNAQALFQFLLHILLWWSLWGLQHVEEFNFLRYLFLLLGPILLYLSTVVLVPDVDNETLDMRFVFENSRKFYYSIIMLFWLWGALTWPVFIGVIGPTTPMLLGLFVIATIIRVSTNPKVHAAIVSLNLLLLVLHIALYSMHMGGAVSQFSTRGG